MGLNVDSQDSLKGYKLSPEKLYKRKSQVARKKLLLS